MAIFEVFSKRQRKAEQKQIDDIYVYDKIPERLRIQVVHIWKKAIGINTTEVWDYINETLSKELGLISLTNNDYRESVRHCLDFLVSCTEEQAIDLIELSFVVLDKKIRNYSSFDIKHYNINQTPDEAIEELNYWFKDNNVGYEFTNRELIRIDQTHMHEKVIKPAISLLFEQKFEGAAEEFLNAHKYYRKGDYKNALVEALKSFESTMKTICDKKGYTYNKGSDTAQKLITVLFENNLIPEYLRNHFSGLRNTLEAGLPTIRNKQAGHGQGSAPTQVEPYFVEYAINLAATNIVFLIKAYKESN